MKTTDFITDKTDNKSALNQKLDFLVGIILPHDFEYFELKISSQVKNITK